MIIAVVQYLEELRKLTNFVYLEGALVVAIAVTAGVSQGHEPVAWVLEGLLAAKGYLSAIREQDNNRKDD